MKIMIYECSAGFTSYTKPLLQALATCSTDDVCLVTEANNPLTTDLPRKQIRAVLKSFSGKTTKNSLRWLVDRTSTSLSNIIRRNDLVKKEKPDILSIQFTIPIFDQFFLSTVKKHSRIVYTAHDVIPPTKSFYWSMKSLKRVYDCSDHIIVHSSANATQLMEAFSVPKEKISIIHHGVVLEYEKLDRTDCRKAIGVDDDTPVFLFYGGIREQKGLDDLIRALKGIKCHLVIAGAMPFGESFVPYEELLKQNGISAFTQIEFISDEFTNVLYQAADVVALPYKYFYSQSGVFMQAIQYEKYILATDVSSFREHIEKWNLGVTCTPGDVQSIHAAAIRLTELIKIGEINMNAAKARYENSWEKSATMHIETFESVMRE